MDIEVPEALRKLKDPWDADKRPADVGGPHDVSYYNGHFYLYFGVVPAVTLFWPFWAVVGYALPAIYTFFFYSIGAFLLASWLWLRIVRDQFPRATFVTRLGGIAAIGLAGGQLALARRTGFWELPILAGHFHMVCMVAACYLALSSRRKWLWLALAGLSLGLAVGSRPTLAAGGAGLAVLVIAVASQKYAAGEWAAFARRGLGAALTAGLPLAAVVAGLMAYNYARFGNPFEFGINYQLTGAHESMGRHFRLSFVPYNFSVYFLLPPQWGRYFPFVHPIVRPAVGPEGYYGIEYVYGVLVICPVIWWALGLAAAVRETLCGSVRAAFAGIVLAVALAMSAILLSFNTAAARYAVDFVPWWVWGGVLGWAFLEEKSAARHLVRGIASCVLRMAFAMSVAFSCALAFFVSIELHGLLEVMDPPAYRTLSRVFNAPVVLVERLAGLREGPVEMDVSFPTTPVGSFEPLVVTGVSYQKDYAFVYYQSSTVVRLGYISSGRSAFLSPNINVVPGHPYRISIESGALFPPEGALYDKGWSEWDIDLAKKWTTIEFDGRPVLMARTSWNEATPGSVRIGRDLRGSPYGVRFSGTIANVHRPKWRRPEFGSASDGEFRLGLFLPEALEGGNQPLVTVGREGHADILGVRMLDRDHHLLIYESWGHGVFESQPFRSPENHKLDLRVRMGPLLPIDDASPLAILRRTVVVWQDETPVFWLRTISPIEANPQFQLLGNDANSSILVPIFKGTLDSFSKGPAPAPWRQGPFSSLEMTLGGRGTATEPLVGAGTLGHSDTLAIDWSGERPRLLYEHSGNRPVASQPFDWQEAKPHVIRVAMPSFGLFGPRVPPGSLSGTLRVDVDGATVWTQPVGFFLAPAGTIAVGRNIARSGMVSGELTVAVLGVTQEIK